MKILVDKMPETETECPYCRDNSTMDYNEYKCIWQNSNHYCFLDDCPYFTEDKGGIKNGTI